MHSVDATDLDQFRTQPPINIATSADAAIQHATNALLAGDIALAREVIAEERALLRRHDMLDRTHSGRSPGRGAPQI
ncbi:hypothetical protein [Qaidamihabitans albus]|uniref:hypothetical protein n=1 Tax=Qaidamihabitans albus TaxID=2795733 RepID=UPI0018F201C3|nr:hypothetical protein [Qaidamihabitans albus]